jgi:hypothetical protein
VTLVTLQEQKAQREIRKERKMLAQKIALFFLVGLFFFGQPTLSEAGCGCDKPPPAPAAVIPKAAFSGMKVTLFSSSFKVGQVWTVIFQNAFPATASVVSKRNITDPSGTKYTPQLAVTVPSSVPRGPTSILAYTTGAYVSVPNTSFTVIGSPVVVSEQNTSTTVTNYTTGVGSDGTVYVTIGGVGNICGAMNFASFMTNYPLRFANGDIAIFNSQGYFINSLIANSGNPPPFLVTPQTGATSDILDYYRHSFATYCTNHLPGGAREVDPADSNWHLNGTSHVDYSTLIFAITGTVNGSAPTAGSISFDLSLGTTN